MLTVTSQRVSFRHELARRGVLGSLPAVLARRLHQRVLDTLLAQPNPDLSLVLHHAAAVDDRETPVMFGPRAARDAAASGAHRQAVEHYRRVLERLASFSPDEQAELLEAYAQESYLVSEGAAAVTAQQRAVDIRTVVGEQVALGTALRRLSRLFWYAGMDAPADEAAQRALEVLGTAGDPVQLAWRTTTPPSWRCWRAAT